MTRAEIVNYLRLHAADSTAWSPATLRAAADALDDLRAWAADAQRAHHPAADQWPRGYLSAVADALAILDGSIPSPPPAPAGRCSACRAEVPAEHDRCATCDAEPDPEDVADAGIADLVYADAEIRQRLDDHVERFKQVETRLRSGEIAIDSHVEELGSLDRRIRGHLNRLEVLETRLAAYDKRLERSERTRAEQQRAAADELAAHEERLELAEETAEAVQGQIGSLLEGIKELAQWIDQFKEKVGAAERRLDGVDAYVEDCERQGRAAALADAEKSLTVMQEVMGLRADVEAVEARLGRAERWAEARADQIALLWGQRNALRADVDRLLARIPSAAKPQPTASEPPEPPRPKPGQRCEHCGERYMVCSECDYWACGCERDAEPCPSCGARRCTNCAAVI